MFTGGEQEYFSMTSIGNFSVFVCSDIQSLVPVCSVASTNLALDALFVCSATPYIEVQKTMVAGDCARLYSYGLIANTCFVESRGAVNHKTAEGQLFAIRPMRDSEKRTPENVKDLVVLCTTQVRSELADSGAFVARSFDLDFGELAFDRGKPALGWLARSASRVSQTVSI